MASESASGKILDAMRERDGLYSNDGPHEIARKGDVVLGGGWTFLEWGLGIQTYLDPKYHPGLWLNLGPFYIGVYVETV